MYYDITEEMYAAAAHILAKDMDYWPDQYPMTYPDGAHDFGLYNIDGTVWLVGTMGSASMKDAVRLVKVL